MTKPNAIEELGAKALRAHRLAIEAGADVKSDSWKEAFKTAMLSSDLRLNPEHPDMERMRIILAALDAAGLEIVLKMGHNVQGRPTIQQLEDILKQEDTGQVRIKPDGSVMVADPDFNPADWKPKP